MIIIERKKRPTGSNALNCNQELVKWLFQISGGVDLAHLSRCTWRTCPAHTSFSFLNLCKLTVEEGLNHRSEMLSPDIHWLQNLSQLIAKSHKALYTEGAFFLLHPLQHFWRLLHTWEIAIEQLQSITQVHTYVTLCARYLHGNRRCSDYICICTFTLFASRSGIYVHEIRHPALEKLKHCSINFCCKLFIKSGDN